MFAERRLGSRKHGNQSRSVSGSRRRGRDGEKEEDEARERREPRVAQPRPAVRPAASVSNAN